jgi:hypothetical protein
MEFIDKKAGKTKKPVGVKVPTVCKQRITTHWLWPDVGTRGGKGHFD